MPSFPPPEKFEPGREDWSQYLDRINYFFAANHVPERDKLPIFFSLLSKEVYSTLCQLLSPVHPSSKSLADVIEVLNKYFEPRILIPVERFRFIRRKQESSESIKDFVKILRHLSTNCDYGDSTALDNRLCEQFVYGLYDSRIRSRLLLEEKLSFDEAIRISLATETAFKGAEELQLEPSSSNVLYHDTTAKTSMQNPSKNFNSKDPACSHCGRTNHKSKDCKLKDASCNNCGMKGHIAPICRSKKKNPNSTKPKMALKSKQKSRAVNTLNANLSDFDEENVTYDISRVSINYANKSSVKIKPIMLDIIINKVTYTMQLDTGASVSIIPNSFYQKFLKSSKLLPVNLVLSTLREKIKPLGKLLVSASFEDKSADELELIVIPDPSVCLIGLTWIDKLNILNQLNKNPVLNMALTNPISQVNKIKLIKTKFPELFSEKLGIFKDVKIKLFLKEDAVPKFFKARPVPFAIKEAVEKELLKLQAQNIISPIQHSDWASPIVVIRKKDSSLRLCGDYKVGVNPSLIVNQYPLPVINDIFAQLSGGVLFSRLDLSQAYQQLQMEETAQSLLTINTHKGLFKVHRMPFGISPAPAIFQQKMDELLSGLPGVICYLDDILVSGKSLEEHDFHLDAVLHRLQTAGITLNEQKCEFLKTQVEYLGHVIDSQGLHASSSKVAGVVEASIPMNVSQLRSFLGLVGYYRKFLPNLTSVLAPLNHLLKKDTKWYWSAEAEDAFNQVKKEIISTKVLIHYDPKLPISLACDASPTGLGAVISHILPNNVERPIAFASRSLLPSERNYSQIDKEALGILFGVKKFHQYLFGRRFILWTDHKPLTRILGENSEIPTMAAARLQRWALTLSAYSYDIKFRSSKENANADALSRSPSSSIFKISQEEDDDSLLIAHLDSFPVNDKKIAMETLKDPILSEVLRFTRDSWPSTPVPNDLEPYFSRRGEISLQDGCLLWGLRVLIPSSLRTLILQELHRQHTGIVRMKMLARSYFWWPNLDKAIEMEAKSCPECAFHSNIPEKAAIHPWIWPTVPWQRIHVDYAGPFLGENFLIIVDAHSKWPEVFPMGSTSTEKTISILENLFSRYGLPSHLVSDNGTQFTSQVFKMFIKQHGIKHSFSSPYHPQSNGQVERFVQTFKRIMKKGKVNVSIKDRVNQLLFSYRSTPHTTTHQTPAFLFLGREIRTHLDLLRPSVQKFVHHAQEKMMSQKDPDMSKDFILGQKVIAREYISKNKWSIGVILKQLGPLTYQVKLPDGRIWKRHTDQLKDATYLRSTSDSSDSTHSTISTMGPSDLTRVPKVATTQPVQLSNEKPVPHRRSTRIKQISSRNSK